jgi:hypothetical protein
VLYNHPGAAPSWQNVLDTIAPSIYYTPEVYISVNLASHRHFARLYFLLLFHTSYGVEGVLLDADGTYKLCWYSISRRYRKRVCRVKEDFEHLVAVGIIIEVEHLSKGWVQFKMRSPTEHLIYVESILGGSHGS